MFDIGATELLLIVIVAVIVIGPKDLPLAMRTAGRWIGKMRKLSGHFRSGIDAMVRDAEMEDMEKKWKAQNEKIMRQHPHATPDEMQPTGAYPPKPRVAAPTGDDAPAPTAELAAKGADEAASRPKPGPEPVPESGPQPGPAEDAPAPPASPTGKS